MFKPVVEFLFTLILKILFMLVWMAVGASAGIWMSGKLMATVPEVA